MSSRRRFSYRSSYPVSRTYVRRRANGGCLFALKRFLLTLLTGIVLILSTIVCGVLLVVLFTHLSRVEALGAHVVAFLTVFGPLLFLGALIVLGVFVVLGLLSGIIGVLAAISERLSYASIARARARQERARAERSALSAPTRPLAQLRLRGSATGRW